MYFPHCFLCCLLNPHLIQCVKVEESHRKATDHKIEINEAWEKLQEKQQQNIVWKGPSVPRIGFGYVLPPPPSS